MILQSRRVVLAGGVQAARVVVEGGRIAAIEPWATGNGGVEDVGEAVLMPGLVDTHVHINEPGRTDWEGFETATMAAAAGGVTTLIDMPLNSIPPTVTPAALEQKRRAASAACWVDVGFWGGLIPGNLSQLPGLVAEGVLGFKCFLVESGVEEFPPVGVADLEAAAPLLAQLRVPLLVHAEDPDVIAVAQRGFRALPPNQRSSYRRYLASRPAEAEVRAARSVADLARRYGIWGHILHLGASGALDVVASSREEGATVTVETCPHYLSFAAEDIPDGATEYKCAPPIRDSANREALWAGLGDGAIDMVVSDHSPCPESLKTGDFDESWGGISSVQLRLPATWTEARARGFGIKALVEWMAGSPARLAGLEAKGTIAPGTDADLVVWDPESSFVVERETLLHRHPPCPYLGRRLYGVVRRTYVRGSLVWEGGARGAPIGELLAGSR